MSRDLRPTVAAVLAFAVLAAGAGCFASDTKSDLDRLVADDVARQDEADGYKARIAEGPELKRQLGDLSLNFKDYVQFLPPAALATETTLLKVIQGYCDVSQVQFQESVMRPGKVDGASGAEFEEVSVAFRIRSSFDEVVKFMNLLEQREPFLRINTFQLTPLEMPKVGQDEDKRDLGISIEVSTYKYIPRKS